MASQTGRIAVLAVAAAAAVVACSSGGETPPPAGATPPPSVSAASPTARAVPPAPGPTPRSTAVPATVPPAPTAAAPTPEAPPASPALTPEPPPPTAPPPAAEPPHIDLQALIVPACDPAPRSSGGGGFGTVPYPSPTPPPDAGENAAERADAFVVAMAPILDSVAHATRAADAAWRDAESPQEFARVLSTEGRRLWLLCNAVAVTPDWGPARQFRSAVEHAFLERSAALAAAVETLREASAAIRDGDGERAASTRRLLDLPRQFDETVRENGETGMVASSAGHTVSSGVLELAIEVPAGWVTVRNQIDIVLAAPPELQIDGVAGLGPNGWGLGAALRIRRLRNEPGWTLADAAGVLDSLLSRLGDRTAEATVEVGGTDGVLHIYAAPDTAWRTLAAATVVGDATYLLELGCPEDMSSRCDAALQRFTRTVEFGWR